MLIRMLHQLSPDALLTAEAAKILGVTPARVRQMHQYGTLTARRTETGTRIFDRSEVERLAAIRAARRAITEAA